MSDVSLNKYLKGCRQEIIEHCTCCGNCTANCEIKRFTSLKNSDPVQVVEAMRRYIESGTYDPLAHDFAFQCINCLECTIHCPEGLEASTLPVLAKARLIEEGYDAPPLFRMAQPCQRYSYQNILSALQTAPADVWWLEKMPENPETREVVLFLGCHDMIFPAAMAATRDILTHMQVDFIAVGGGKNFCCGAVHLNTGEPAVAHEMGRHLIDSLTRFQPETVLFTCPTCVYYVRKTLLDEESSGLKYQHLSKFIAERLDRLTFKQPLNTCVTVQDPCFTARGLGDYDSPRRVLSAINKLRLVEMKHNRENALCCGATALGNNPPEVAEAFIRNRLNEAREAGADVVASLCAGCHLTFFPREKDFGIESRLFSEVVAEALGFEVLPDRMKQFRDLGDSARIIEAARHAISESAYSEDEISSILPVLFR